MLSVTNAFRALSDPVRIEILHRLSQEDSPTLSEISSGLKLTRQGVRKHLSVLEQAGIIELHKKGRTTKVQFKPDSLLIVKKFIEKLESQWDKRLLALKDYVEKGLTPHKQL